MKNLRFASVRPSGPGVQAGAVTDTDVPGRTNFGALEDQEQFPTCVVRHQWERLHDRGKQVSVYRCNEEQTKNRDRCLKMNRDAWIHTSVDG